MRTKELETSLIRKPDLPRLAEISAASFQESWREDHFFSILQLLYTGGYCLRSARGEVAGYCVTSSNQPGNTVEVLTLAVAPEFRFQGIATAMLRDLQRRVLATDHWDPPRILAVVGELNLPAQLLLRRCGFRCIRTVPSGHERGMDALDFEWRVTDGGV